MSKTHHFGSEVTASPILADRARRTPSSHTASANGAWPVYVRRAHGTTPEGTANGGGLHA